MTVYCYNVIVYFRAMIRKCNNAPYPDLYGHYREAKFTQTKHHWWWKANRVFNQLEITRNHIGDILCLLIDCSIFLVHTRAIEDIEFVGLSVMLRIVKLYISKYN